MLGTLYIFKKKGSKFKKFLSENIFMYASYSKEKIKIHRSAVLNHGIIATLIICTYMQVCTSRVTYLKAKMVIMVRANYFCNIISPVIYIYIYICVYIYIYTCMYVCIYMYI